MARLRRRDVLATIPLATAAAGCATIGRDTGNENASECPAPAAGGSFVRAGDWPMHSADPGNTGVVPDAIGPAVDATDASPRRVADSIHTNPILAGGWGFFREDQGVLGIDLATGTTVWQTPFDNTGRLLVANGQVLVPAWPDEIVSLDPTTGCEYWRHSVDGHLTIFTVADDVLYYATRDSVIVGALSMQERRQLWSFGTSFANVDSLAVRGDTLFAHCTGRPRADEPDVVLAADVESGEERWRQSFTQGLSWDLVAAGDTVYAVTVDRRVVALSEVDGAVRWRTDRSMRVDGPVAATADTVYVVEENGTISSADAATGAVEQLVSMDRWAPLRGIPSVGGGRLYVPGGPGTIIVDPDEGNWSTIPYGPAYMVYPTGSGVYYVTFEADRPGTLWRVPG